VHRVTDREKEMITARLKGKVTPDHRLELKVPRSVPPGGVEVILLRESPEPRKTQTRKLNPNIHPAAGLWAD
jgi:hypothetical protein